MPPSLPRGIRIPITASEEWVLTSSPERVYKSKSAAERTMAKRASVAALFLILTAAFPPPAGAQKRLTLPPRLLTAKFIYFENQTGFPAVGDESLRELERWGRFRLVRSPDQADLLFVLSSKVESDALANPNDERRFGPDLSFHFRYRPANAYLTVDDAITGERLWSGRHVWGGLLTGFNSAGRRLIHKLRKQVER